MINGILNINKPEGITSAKAVSKIKKKLQFKKAGHTGTLDPFATGILLVCLNRATKITQYLSVLDKEYIGIMVLGVTTDTQDLKGRVLKIKNVNHQALNIENLEEVFASFQGRLWQKPPMFSALRHKGLRLYSLARKGIEIDLDPRKIFIKQISILKIKVDYFPSITFKVKCSKGTYIRTLCNDIGQKLGCGAFLSRLERTEIGNHNIQQSIDLDKFLRMPLQEQYKNILSIDKALNNFNKIILLKDKEIEDRVKNGGPFSEKEISEIINEESNNKFNDRFRVSSYDGNLLAIGKKVEDFDYTKKYRVEKVFS